MLRVTSLLLLAARGVSSLHGNGRRASLQGDGRRASLRFAVAPVPKLPRSRVALTAELAAEASERAEKPTPSRAASIFTGRWVDPDKPPRRASSLFTLAQALGEQLAGAAGGAAPVNTTRLQREFLRMLEGIDRGDFRWEFLTPWRKQQLTAFDKLIVCITFISTALVSQYLWDPEASLFDHLSYLVFFFAYAIANNATLRQLAILGSTFEILAFVFDERGFERAEIVPVSYEVIFIVINSYYAMRAFLAEQPIEFEEIEQRVYQACFEPCGLTPRQFVKILESAEWHVSVEEELLTRQGEPVMDVFVPLSGNFSIVSDERGLVAAIAPLVLVGEVSLLENLQSEGGRYHRRSIASMVAPSGATYVRWPQSTFYELMRADAEFARAMQVMISKALSKKLLQLWESNDGVAQQPITEPPVPVAETSG